MGRYGILGVGIDNLTPEEILRKIEGFIENKGFQLVVTANPLMLNFAQRDRKFKSILQQANLVVADGWGLVWAAWFLGYPRLWRNPGIDLLKLLSGNSVKKGYRLYLLGGKPGVAEKARQNLVQAHPGLNIVGQRPGYFTAGEEKRIVEEIRQKEPDILLVGLGSPRQENWIMEHKKELGVAVCLGVGGSFDILAGSLRRSPPWLREHGMEWLGRFAQQPWRIQQIPGLVSFVFKVIKQKYVQSPKSKVQRRHWT